MIYLEAVPCRHICLSTSYDVRLTRNVRFFRRITNNTKLLTILVRKTKERPRARFFAAYNPGHLRDDPGPRI